MKKIYFIIAFIILSNTLRAQFRIKFGQECYGVIMSDSTSKPTSFLGTGFAIDSNILVTCYHVYKYSSNKPAFFFNIMDRAIPIELIDSLPSQDIALYRTPYRITGRPMKLAALTGLAVGDSIIYAGYDIEKRANYFSFATISNEDSILINGFLVKRIMFNGITIGRYSGGPLFDRNGNVIGLIDQKITRKSDGAFVTAIDNSVEQL